MRLATHFDLCIRTLITVCAPRVPALPQTPKRLLNMNFRCISGRQ